MKKIKYNVNENYFEKIDTAEKAYWLGFLYADGHNTEFPYWRISLILKKQDKDHVKKFNNILYPMDDKNITIRKSDGAIGAVAHSKKLCEDLAKLNVVNRKSLIIEFPTNSQVPDNLLVYFIQGLFDGDGSVSVGKTTKTPCAMLDFTGSISLIRTLQNILNKLSGVEFRYKERKFLNTVAVTYIKGNDKVLQFLNWLYADSTYVLPRKYKKYQEIQQIKNTIIENKSSKYRGVYYRRNKPHSTIQSGNKTYYLGKFNTEEEAALAYNKKAIELFGNNAKINII